MDPMNDDTAFQKIKMELEYSEVSIEEIIQVFSEMSIDYCTMPQFYDSTTRCKKAAALKTLFHILTLIKENK